MKIVELNSWSDIQNEFNKFNPLRELKGGYDRFKDFYLFRGQRESSWELTSTLDRSGLADSIENFEFEFKQKVNLVGRNHLKEKSNLELYSEMRHYNVPSPLIDFTFSPYIALYFAFESFLNDNFEQLSKSEFDKKNTWFK